MSNPIEILDDWIHSQLTGFAPLTAIISADLIGQFDRLVDLRDPNTLGDDWARVFIVPNAGNPEQFRSGSEADLVLNYEINVFVAGKAADRLRQIEYEIWRALVQFGEYQDGGGSALNNASLSPFDLVGSQTSPWRYQLLGGNVLRSFMGLSVRLDVQRSDLISSAAPTLQTFEWLYDTDVSGPLLANIPVLGIRDVAFARLTFSARMNATLATAIGDGTDFVLTDGLTGENGVGMWYYSTGADRYVYLLARDSGTQTTPAPGTGNGTLDYTAATGDLKGANGIAVANFTGFTIPDFPTGIIA